MSEHVRIVGYLLEKERSATVTVRLSPPWTMSMTFFE